MDDIEIQTKYLEKQGYNIQSYNLDSIFIINNRYVFLDTQMIESNEPTNRQSLLEKLICESGSVFEFEWKHIINTKIYKKYNKDK
jgi:hypothetical protein